MAVSIIVKNTIIGIIHAEKSFETDNGWIRPEIPSISKMFAILLPKIFPKAMVGCFLNMAAILTLNSGSEVPTATKKADKSASGKL